MQFQVLTVLARTSFAAGLVPGILGGRIRESAALAEDLLATKSAGAAAPEEASEIAQLCGDLMLALDRAEEAEDAYRLAVKSAAGAKRGAVRVVSCRSTGMLSLHQHRFATAAACFTRIVDDEAASVAQRVEAFCALAVAHQDLGHKARALESLDEAGCVARESGTPDLTKLVCLMRAEFTTHVEIRSHESLFDHVFWQSQPSVRSGAAPPVQPLGMIEMCMAAHGRDDMVAHRLMHLRDLVLASYGDAAALGALTGHLARLRSSGLLALERQSRIDTALVAIVHRKAELARAVIDPLQSRDTDAGARRRWQLELSYCQAKISTLGGRADEAMQHYQRYASEVMQRVRVDASATERHQRPVSTASPATPVAVKDDIEMRLPAKYRRAYRYMQEHLYCADLRVREIAADMGVTERALQSAFRRSLGMTPGEVIQRCRVERIRADLLRDESPSGSVNETAARWGIRNRSTLITSYRKHFRETPTETLARRGSSSSST